VQLRLLLFTLKYFQAMYNMAEFRRENGCSFGY
jgi:hypothetical protein